MTQVIRPKTFDPFWDPVKVLLTLGLGGYFIYLILKEDKPKKPKDAWW